MEDSIKSNNKVNLTQNRALKYSNNQYNFKNVLAIPLLLDKIFKFMEKEDIKCLSLCCKKIYHLYCSQIKKLKIKEDIEASNISKIKFDKYEYLIELDLKWCRNIKDYSIISNLEKLEYLNLYHTNISDISFLEKNKNIKTLDLEGCKNIKDFSFISNLEKLEILDISFTNISDISFLEKIKNITTLNIMGCWNIKDYTIISNLKKNKNFYVDYYPSG